MTKERTIEVMNSILEYTGIGRREFSNKIGVENPQWIADVLNPNKKVGISKEKAERICKIYPESSILFLTSGDGPMLKDTSVDFGSGSTSVAMARKEKPFRTYFKEEQVRMVPVLNLDSVGGMHSKNEVGVYDEHYVMDRIPFKNALVDDVAIFETGDSMAPRIPSGALLLLRQVVDWREYFGYGHVFVLVITKRVTKCLENPKEYVLCESINPVYPSEELPKAMITAVWKVIDVLVHEGY